ncbi:MAG: competence/damage-inducible protein A [Candidatus Marinimicrobia bacterium]|nr:competence/damage-inducible protein A [Candidatus Neomarinimicrobiota bacterium]|tara:strand:- start:3211 stop:3957 length:747 start_codon:yes stop_codon:yes gene_type:complete
MTLFTAGIIIIGDEILSGRTKDTNANFIAKNLISSGIKLEEIKVIQDNKEIIIDSVKIFSGKYNYVFTTGGIGPTHDDITSESIAEAFNKKNEINKEAFNILKKYYPDGEFNTSRQRMAKIPADSQLIYNPLTAAPGFILNNVYVLPGVPKIMEEMFINVLKNLKKGKPKKITTINTNLYESKLAPYLKEIQLKHIECSIGSYPYFNFISKTGGVNIVLSSWTMDSLKDLEKEIIEIIKLNGGNYSIV